MGFDLFGGDGIVGAALGSDEDSFESYSDGDNEKIGGLFEEEEVCYMPFRCCCDHTHPTGTSHGPVSCS